MKEQMKEQDAKKVLLNGKEVASSEEAVPSERRRRRFLIVLAIVAAVVLISGSILLYLTGTVFPRKIPRETLVADLLAPNDDPGPGPGPTLNTVVDDPGPYKPICVGDWIFLVDVNADVDNLRSTDFPSYSEYKRYIDEIAKLSTSIPTPVQPLATDAATGQPISAGPADK